MTLSIAIRSTRLRTLPLSLSGVCLGMMLAASKYEVSFGVIFFLILTTASLQILSNLSNELGDVLHGTDTEDRQGPQYGLNSGAMTVKDMKALIGIFIGACIVFGLSMIYCSFKSLVRPESVVLMALGAAAIIAAMKYTLGENPYGYRGMGDFFVFIFFGLVSVMGGYYVAAHTIDPLVILPASAVGCFSIGVLNTNNIRDMKTDAVNRVTVAIKLGLRGARIYQTILIVLGWVLLLVFTIAMKPVSVWHFAYFITLPLYIKHLKGVWHLEEHELDKMLPLLVMSTFILAFIAGITFIVA